MSQSSEQGAPEVQCVGCGHIRAGKSSGDMCMYPFVEGGPCTHRCEFPPPVPQTDAAVSPEPLPCPFCGGKPEIHVHNSEYRDGSCFDIQCSPCGLQTEIGFYYEEGLVKWWNTRTCSDICASLVEALEQIAKGEGAFSLDHFTHACNTIDNMKSIARTALAQVRDDK